MAAKHDRYSQLQDAGVEAVLAAGWDKCGLAGHAGSYRKATRRAEGGCMFAQSMYRTPAGQASFRQ